MKKIIFFSALFFLFFSINAATITVCASGCDYDSVKTAVGAAVADDVIQLSAETYTDYNITIDKNLTIEGAGMYDTIVQAYSKEAGGSHRVFKVTSGTVIFRDLTIRYGYSDYDGDSGGGIMFEGTALTVERCFINANKSYYYGAGIYSSAGTVNIIDSVILGNRASSTAGGIYAYNSSWTIESSTISGNSGSVAGGIYLTRADMVISDSTVSGNTASSYGGGIYVYNASTLSINNSTVSNNFAYDHDGGGLYNASGCTTKINNGTFAGNFAMDEGGGIFNTSAGRVEMRNTIIADNMAGTEPNDCFGVLDSYGYNLIENLSFCAIGTDNSHNVLGRDPKLEPLSTNGGATATHAILYDSPAFDAGACTDMDGNAILTDQRGIGRPYGVTCDIGAYEYSGEIPSTKYACWDHNEDDICQPLTEDFNGDGDCTVQDCKGEDGLSCWDLDGDRVCDTDTEDHNGDNACTITDCRGTPGPSGYACWDLIANHTCDATEEDMNGDGFCNIQDCQGTAGEDGKDGYNCWDLDHDYTCDPEENKNADGDCTVADCQGVQGEDGAMGVSCWDLNANGVCDTGTEDANNDTQCNVLDCRGAQGEAGANGADGADGSNGADGEDGADGVDGYSCWDTNMNHICDPAEDLTGDTFCTVADCIGANGYSCWDLDADYECDPNEDKNDDNACTPADCKGETGDDGADGINCWDTNGNGVCDLIDCRGASDGFSCWDLNMNRICDPSEDIDGSGECLVNDCRGLDGEDGADGKDGKDGVDGTDGTNGTDGTDGKDGKDGVDGTNGTNGEDGEDGINGKDGTNGEDGEDGEDGTDGISSLVSISDEPAGDNCVDGGKKIDSGIDTNGDGILQENEIQSTDFVCNGEAGVDGEDGLNGKSGSGCSVITF